jgi:hypothetical protein
MGKFEQYADDAPVAPVAKPRPSFAAYSEKNQPANRDAYEPETGPQEDYGTADAVSREASNIFGAGPAMAAGLETLASKIPVIGPKYLGDAGYDQRRAIYAHGLDVGRRAHPIATGITGALRGIAEASAVGAAAPAMAAAGAGTQGLLYGLTEGTGESISHGDTGTDALIRPAVAGLSGMVAGKAFDYVGRKLTGGEAGEAAARLRKQVGNDIVGDKRGASTMTARKQMSDDIADVQDVVLADPTFEKALHDARTQAPTKLGAALDMTEAKLAPLRAERAPLYKELDAALPEGGVRSGDYVKHLEHSASELEATGEGQDESIATQLRDRAALIKRSRKWGGNTDVFDPSVKMGKDTAGDLVRGATIARDEAKTSAQRAAYDEIISNIKANASYKGFDPDTIVPTELVRDNVTDLQETAFKGNLISTGGVNETQAYKRARETARHASDFLTSVKQTAAERLKAAHGDSEGEGPDLIDRLNEHDKQVSALLHVSDVLKQRFNRAGLDELGGTEESLFGKGLQLISKHGALKAASGAASRGMLAAGHARDVKVRGIDRGDVGYAGTVLHFIREGMSLTAAVAAAQQAAQSGDE